MYGSAGVVGGKSECNIVCSFGDTVSAVSPEEDVVVAEETSLDVISGDGAELVVSVCCIPAEGGLLCNCDVAISPIVERVLSTSDSVVLSISDESVCTSCIVDNISDTLSPIVEVAMVEESVSNVVSSMIK